MKIGKISIVVVLLLSIGLGIFLLIKYNVPSKIKDWQKEQEKNQILSDFNNTAVAQPNNILNNLVNTANNVTQEEEEPIAIKDQVLLDVQFIPQGPLDPGEAHWDIHAESCEEAAMLMAHNYAVNKSITMQQAHEQLLAMKAWQVENFGSEHDIYADEVREFLIEYFGHKQVKIINNASVDDIKRELSQGYPVIIPTIAAYLHNPRYYDQDYHMFLAIGYTKDRIIAHDNGTTWGDNYPYPYQDFMEALNATGGDVVVIYE